MRVGPAPTSLQSESHEEEIRTPTPCGLDVLSVVCLPVPPHGDSEVELVPSPVGYRKYCQEPRYTFTIAVEPFLDVVDFKSGIR